MPVSTHPAAIQNPFQSILLNKNNNLTLQLQIHPPYCSRMELNEKQLAANRANALKSTGPKTPAGKRISSRNAIRHGFLAQSILLPGESRERFFELFSSLLSQFSPATPYEYALVDTMAVTRWRQQRAWTLETASLIHEQQCQSNADTTNPDQPTRAMLAMKNLALPPRSLEALSRYEGRFDRQYHRAADRLFRIQAERIKNAATNPAKPQNKGDRWAIHPIPTTIEVPSKPDRTACEAPLDPADIKPYS